MDLKSKYAPSGFGLMRTSSPGRLLTGARFLSRDPAVDVLLKHIQRHRARKQHRIVEFADIEALADLAPGALA